MPKNQSSNQSKGFTLIEIVIVVAIMAAVSLMVSFSLGGDLDRKAKLQAQRFIAVVSEVRDEAILNGDNFALIVDESENYYRFISTREGDQSSSQDQFLYKTRKIDDDIKLDWQVLDYVANDDDFIPKVILTSLGEITPFELIVSGSETDYLVFLNEQGQLKMRARSSSFSF